MPQPHNDNGGEQPKLKNKAWSAPEARGLPETKIASRLKAITIVLVILGAAIAVVYLMATRG